MPDPTPKNRDPRKMIVALQFWEGDKEKAMRLARPIADIEPAKNETSQKIVKEAFEARKSIDLPSWLKVSESPLSGTVVNLPALNELQVPIEAQLIVEYMSR
jgi:ribosomal protein S4